MEDELKAIINSPPDAEAINGLVADKADLLLMMPSAAIPFKAEQWLEKLQGPGAGLSYFMRSGGETIGHFAFLRIDRQAREAALCWVYLAPPWRGKGFSKKMIALSEQIAKDQLDLKTVVLNVREHNLPAYKLYSRMGYAEYARENGLIRMRHQL